LKYKYISKLPKPLLDDFVANRWLPIVGAGFSRNAILPKGLRMPLWDELGRALAKELGDDYEYLGPIDAISSYEHKFKRSTLVESLLKYLFIGEARPGDAHRAFCSARFDIVCTTNFDFLLERGYRLCGVENAVPVIGEDQLSITHADGSIPLLKLHGDLYHPKLLVITEDDYDGFLKLRPAIATYFANLLMTRTPVLVGYSLDDPDLRQIWRLVGQRLGTMKRQAYALLVGASESDIARFDRRGVKAIVLGKTKSKYGEVLASVFRELNEYRKPTLVKPSNVKEEHPLQELSLPPGATTRLCLFVIPLWLQALYRDQVFPLVRQVGLVPMTADDMVSPGENVFTKIEVIIDRSPVIVVDASSESTQAVLRMALNRIKSECILVILSTETSTSFDISDIEQVWRLDFPSGDNQRFLDDIQRWLKHVAEKLEPALSGEPRRLLDAGEYRAAVISAMALLENSVREQLPYDSLSRARASFSVLIRELKRRECLGELPVDQMAEWWVLRNKVVHGPTLVKPDTAKQIVAGVEEIIAQIAALEKH